MDKSKHEYTILIGPSGSGKDYLLNKLVEKGLTPCLKYTTRPHRNLELQGVTYNFVNNFEFISTLQDNKFLVYEKFNIQTDKKDAEIWYYGITKENFESSQVCIMTVGEFQSLPSKVRNKCFVVYLDIEREIRESRIHQRDDKNDSVKRRLDSDEIDFEGFSDYDLRITDPEFTAEDIYNLIN